MGLIPTILLRHDATVTVAGVRGSDGFLPCCANTYFIVTPLLLVSAALHMTVPATKHKSNWYSSPRNLVTAK